MSRISRRSFLSWVAKGAAVLGISSVVGSRGISIPDVAGASNQEDVLLNEKVVDSLTWRILRLIYGFSLKMRIWMIWPGLY